MNAATLQVRRATIEDLPELKRLWEEAQLSVLDLEKRFKEFQVVYDDAGLFLGAVGLQVAGNQGHLHSEVFAEPIQEDLYRDKLWERIATLARNHGLVRIWTLENAPYWHHAGFALPPNDVLTKLPNAFGTSSDHWNFFKLKEEFSRAVTVDQEFAIFMQEQRLETERVRQRAKTLKTVALAIAAAVFMMSMFLAVMIYQKGWLTSPR